MFSEADVDWMHNAPWEPAEFAAARELAKIGRAKLAPDSFTEVGLVKFAPEIEHLLPPDRSSGIDEAMRFRIAARALGILSGKVDHHEG